MSSTQNTSIVIPARNEEAGLQLLLPDLQRLYPEAEILVVNDGSTDDTEDVCNKLGVRHVRHPYTKGNGAAVKTGARHAGGEILVFMDADGQHAAEDVSSLVDKIDEGYDMVVGARESHGQASIMRLFGNQFYNWLASLISGHKVADLTSGFRSIRKEKFLQFLYLLPNGFSYPTSITMAFFRAGYSVAYLPIDVKKRLGKSHLRPLRDGIRFLLIIFKIGTLYSPLKIFIPTSAVFFTAGVAYYGYTFLTENRFTNMSALLLIVAIMVFLIGLVSEQVTTLIYSRDTTIDASSNDKNENGL